MKKICTKCNLEKNSSEFRKDKTKPDGFQTFCKICARLYHKKKYAEQSSNQYNKRNAERRARQLDKLREYKRKLSCTICGEDEHIVLEFHHLDPTQKEFTVGSSMHFNWERIELELSKCVVLCCNCHRKLHAGLFDLI